MKPRCDPGREQPPALPFRKRQKHPGYTERGLPGGGGRGARRAEGTACDRVWQGRLRPADTGAELGALAIQGGEAAGVGGPGVSGDNEACPGCHRCKAQSQLWDRVGGSVRPSDGKLILEPQCGRSTGAKSDRSPGSGSRDKGRRGEENQSQKGWVMGASCKWEGPKAQGEKFEAGLGGLPNPWGTLPSAPAMGLGRWHGWGWAVVLGPPEYPAGHLPSASVPGPLGVHLPSSCQPWRGPLLPHFSDP